MAFFFFLRLRENFVSSPHFPYGYDADDVLYYTYVLYYQPVVEEIACAAPFHPNDAHHFHPVACVLYDGRIDRRKKKK